MSFNSISGFGSITVAPTTRSKILICGNCERKYIKTRDEQKNCLICTPMEVSKNACKKCGRVDIRLNGARKVIHALCTPCNKIRLKEYNANYKKGKVLAMQKVS